MISIAVTLVVTASLVISQTLVRLPLRLFAAVSHCSISGIYKYGLHLRDLCARSSPLSSPPAIKLQSTPEGLYQVHHKSGLNMSPASETPMPPLSSTEALHSPTRVEYDLERTSSPNSLTLAERRQIIQRLIALSPAYRRRVTNACYGYQEYALWNLQLLQAEDENWRFSLSDMNLQWVERVEMLSEYVGVVEGMMRAKWRRMALRIDNMRAQIPETPPWRRLRIAANCVRDFHMAFYRPDEQERVFYHHRLVLERRMRAVAENYSNEICELWQRLHGFLIASECLKRNYWMFTGAFNDMDRWYSGLRPPHRPRDGRPDDPRWEGRFNERAMIWMNILSHLPSLDGDLPSMYEWVAELTAQVNSQAERISLGYP